MVDVTKQNFDSIKKEIAELLPNCAFVSIDLEFSGLFDPRHGTRNQPDDLPSQRYMKLRDSIHNFLMIQFGLCIYRYDSSSSKLTAHPFNLWTFPQNHRNSLFLSDSSALLFLREHGFDFNQWIDGGIDFMSIDNEKRERQNRQYHAQKKQERCKDRKQSNRMVEPRNSADIQLFKSIESKIEQFMASNNKSNDNSNGKSNGKLDDVANGGILHLGLQSRFMRLLIYQLIDQKYSNQLIAYKVVDTDSNRNRRQIAVKRVTADSRTRLQSEADRKLESEWNESLFRKIGVRHIFDLLVQHRVPVVLHNGMLDSMHLYRSFIGNLPEDPCVFTKRFHDHFPFLIDTKYMMKILFREQHIEDNFSLSQCFWFFIDSDSKRDSNGDSEKESEKESEKKCESEPALNNLNADICSVFDIEVCIRADGKRDSEKESSFMHSKDGAFHQAGYGMNL